jgi:peptidoglycan/LPS O-acetylase OafA/YrhL
MQVYILMPVILWLVRVTRGKHTLLLAVAFAIQAAMAACFMYWPDVLALIAPTAKEYFFIYVFFILAGAVAADHSDSFLAWVRRRRGWIGLGTAAAAVITLAVFLIQIALGASFYHAGTPLQPIIIFWSVAIGMGFLAFGTWWADRRTAGSATARIVDVASDRSFGIFLAHPLFIWLLLWVGDDWLESVVPTPWLTLVTYILVIALAWGVSDLARRTPLSLPLAGRPFRRRTVKASAA